MNPLGIVIASQRVMEHAHSALPRSPVIDQPSATLVRRIAARLGPNHQS